MERSSEALKRREAGEKPWEDCPILQPKPLDYSEACIIQEPFSMKAITDAITSFWGFRAVVLWCLACVCFVLFMALAAGRHWHVGDTSALFSAYGTFLGLAFPVLVVVAALRTYIERSKPVLLLLPKDQESFWRHAKRPNGQIITQFSLEFSATNISDSSMMLSNILLRRPFIRRRHVIVNHILINNIHSFTFFVQPHSLTDASAEIMIDYPVGRAGHPIRVVVRLRDQAGKWHRLIFPHIRSMPVP
jgi:hypothetical protein